MSEQLQYIYAMIDLNDNQCIGVSTTTICHDGDPEFVALDSYNEDYLFKYYIDGAWYVDAAGQIPWSPEE